MSRPEKRIRSPTFQTRVAEIKSGADAGKILYLDSAGTRRQVRKQVEDIKSFRDMK